MDLVSLAFALIIILNFRTVLLMQRIADTLEAMEYEDDDGLEHDDIELHDVE